MTWNQSKHHYLVCMDTPTLPHPLATAGDTPFTRLTFTVHVFVTKEAVAIVTGDLISRSNILQYQNTRCVAASWYKL